MFDLEGKNALAQLFTSEELETYQRTHYPFNLSLIHTALKQKLKQDPNYEVWVPLIYYRYAPLLKKQQNALVTRPDVFISNKGNIYHRGKKKLITLTPDNGYMSFGVTRHREGAERLMAHRAVACAFLSLDEFLLANEGVESAHPKDLQVNHLDGVKVNFDLGNLEWCTGSGNTTHAYDMGLSKTGVNDCQTKPIKVTLAVGEMQGYEFLMFGVKQCGVYGFQQPNVSAVCNGRLKTHKGCAFSFATEEEVASLPREADIDMVKSLCSK